MAARRPTQGEEGEGDAQLLNRNRGDLVTVPDPSRLTTAQLLREIESVQSFFDARFKEYDKAIDLLQRKADKEPQISSVNGEVQHLRELTGEQIANVKILIDKTGELNNTALQAAFAAAKEAVGAAQIASATANTKMETNFTKQLDATGLLISTMEKALSGKIEDVKAQVITSMPRVEVMSSFVALSDRVSSLEKFSNNLQGRMWVIAAVVVIMEVALRFLAH